jgi:hypothetical protein
MSVSQEANTDCLAAALGYGRRGWRVIPNKCRGKAPWLTDWPNAASCDEATIRTWWARCPGSNVGILCGRASGIVVVDLDGAPGIEAFRQIVNSNGGSDGEPLRAVSGSGSGRHLIYGYTPQCDALNNRTKVSGSPIDIKTNGGNLIVAPSLHASGGRYQWLTLPSMVPGPIPEWLVEFLLTVTERKAKAAPPPPRRLYTDNHQHVIKRAMAYLSKIPPAISGCGGHNQTMSAARDMVYGFDLGVEIGLELLANFYNPRCDPPWSYKELLHKCEDADSKPFDKPRGYLRNAEEA